MIRRVDDVVVPPAPSIPEAPAATRRLAVAGVAAGVALGALIGGITLERIVHRARGTTVTSMEGPPEARVDPVAARIAAVISAERIRETIEWLARPELAGRDTPSLGLGEAQVHVAERMRSFGLTPTLEAQGKYLWPFTSSELEFGRTPGEVPESDACALALAGGPSFTLGEDFVPLLRSSLEDPLFRGAVTAEVVFAGYGIDSASEGYDDFEHVDVTGRIALVLAGEPMIGDRFGGPDVTAEASIWNKIDALERNGAVGALVVAPDGDGVPLDFRATRASWNPPAPDRVRAGLPTLVITPRVAQEVLGYAPDAALPATLSAEEPLSVVADRRSSTDATNPRVRLAAGTRRVELELFNVVGWLAGTDARATDDYVVVGAHLDHIGVGPRGRIGRGADDNASGVAAMLAVAEALSRTPPELSVLFVAFSGEEDGLLGSRALAADLPRGRARCRAMLNLDMVGRGPTDETVVLGIGREASPRVSMGAAVEAALATGATGLARVRAVDNLQFFSRSDHYAFHEVGVPSLFLFEDWPHDSPDYHTWRDVPERVDPEKVRRTAILAALVTRELARR